MLLKIFCVIIVSNLLTEIHLENLKSYLFARTVEIKVCHSRMTLLLFFSTKKERVFLVCMGNQLCPDSL